VDQYDHFIGFLGLLVHPDENQPHTALKENLLSSCQLTNIERIDWLIKLDPLVAGNPLNSWQR
jgi:hypothetical protein